MTDSDATHTETENDPWTIDVGDHPDRSDSPQYRRSRELMIKLVQTTQPWLLGDPPYQDHHGGGIWVKDASGWLLVLGLAGIEWSAQFCADPAKVDLLRVQAQRILGGFPDTVSGYEELGYHDAAGLLSTPIVDADGIEAWTDGIVNASVPLSADRHTGVLPAGGGYTTIRSRSSTSSCSSTTTSPCSSLTTVDNWLQSRLSEDVVLVTGVLRWRGQQRQ